MATTTAAACCAPLGAPGRPPPGQDPQPAGHQPEPVGVGEVTEPLGWRRPTVSHHPQRSSRPGCWTASSAAPGPPFACPVTPWVAWPPPSTSREPAEATQQTDQEPARAGPGPLCRGPDQALDRDHLPDTALLASLGCGNPTAVADLHEVRRLHRRRPVRGEYEAGLAAAGFDEVSVRCTHQVGRRPPLGHHHRQETGRCLTARTPRTGHPRSCSSVSTTPGAVRWPPPSSTTTPGARSGSGRPGRRRPTGSTRRCRGHGRVGHRPVPGVPQAAHRRLGQGSRRGRLHGLRGRLPGLPGKRYEDWELQDPAGQPVEVVRRIRDDIDGRVRRLLDELVPSASA
jgi:hypothetical protein